MNNYQASDYALDKHSKGIGYRFAEGSVTVALADILREDPEKTDEEFAELKAESDAIYSEQDRAAYRQTWKNVSLPSLEGLVVCTDFSPEKQAIDRPELEAREQVRRSLAKQALATLTEIQRRRYILYHAAGLNECEIAKKEGATQQAVSKGLDWAKKKIKIFLEKLKK